jgi:O-antigen/teichoic acid export membrane protein
LTESYPFALTALAATLYARVDLLLLGLWQGEVAVGLYGAAYRLWEAIGLLPASLLDAMFPELSRLAGSADGHPKLRSLFRRVGRVMLVSGILLAVASALGATMLISLVYGATGDYALVTFPFRLLVCGIPAMFLYLLSGHTLYALGKQRQVTVVMIAVGLLNVSLNLIVIPRWGLAGAATIALFSEWLLAGILVPLASRAVAAG